MRIDGRRSGQLRPISATPNFIEFAEGSVLFSMGNTHVLCNLTLEESVPRWMQQQNKPGGWITAEYAMLPRSTQIRTPRETNGLGGRTQEIRRLIGRSLRTVVNLELLGQRTAILDCDVLQADGGTRTAAITGSYLALAIGLLKLIKNNELPSDVLRSPIAAVSVGILAGIPLLDLCYAEDSQAEVDANIVMNADGEFIEIQSTAERNTFNRNQFDQLLNLAYQGIGELLTFQKDFLADIV
jgi:ribonuclease PH